MMRYLRQRILQAEHCSMLDDVLGTQGSKGLVYTHWIYIPSTSTCLSKYLSLGKYESQPLHCCEIIDRKMHAYT